MVGWFKLLDMIIFDFLKFIINITNYILYMRQIFSNVTQIGIFGIIFIFTMVNDDPCGPYSIFMNPFIKHIHSVNPSLIKML